MMKALNVTLLCSLIIITLSAQPVVSDSWIPEVDDVWNQSVTIDTPEPGESGANIVWDYSDLNVQGFLFQIIFNWVDPATTPYVDSFPEATVCANLQSFGYGYYQDDVTRFNYLGSGNQFGLDVFNSPQTFEFIGMEFETTVVDSYDLVRYNNFSSPRMPVGKTSYTYDAYGTLILPHVTIEDAIRIFQIDVETDSLVQGTVANVRVDSLVTYAWIADGSVFPVAMWQRSAGYSRIYFNDELFDEDIDEPDTTFSINPDYTTTSAVSRLVDLPKLDIFPAIARNELNVRSAAIPTKIYTIYSMAGNLVDQGVLNGDLMTLDIGQLHQGNYILRVEGYAPAKFVKIE